MKIEADYYNQNRSDVAVLCQFPIGKILDIGCGEGLFLESIKKTQNAETWGIELDPIVAKKAADRIDHLLNGPVEEKLLEIPDHFFDCITFNDVLEHLYDPYRVLEQVSAKIAPGGKVVASIPNIRYFNHLRNYLFGKDWKYTESGILDSTHVRFFTEKSILRMFEEAGYNVESLKGINAMNSWKFRLFNTLTFGFFNDTRFFRFVCIATPRI